MPKVKTHKGVLKRVRITARGKVKYRKNFGRHLMSGKSGKRVRQLRRPEILTGSIARRLRLALAGRS